MKNYKLFVFDFGEVMQDDHLVWEDFFEQIGFGRKNVRAFGPNATNAVTQMIVGKMDEPEFWQNVQKDMGASFPCDDLLYKIWKSTPVAGMEDLVKEIKAKGYRVICGTNNIYPFWKKIRDNHMYDVFEKVYSSYDIQIAKPDVEFWKYIAKEENVKPEDMFFVDDRADNCKAAESLGITAHQLKSADGLRAQLKELGIL